MNLFIGKGGQQLGPFNEDQVRTMIQTGMLSSADLAWHDGRPDWVPVGQLLGIAPPLPATTQSTPAADSSAKPYIIAGYVCAVMAFLFLPLGFGTGGVIFGIRTLMRKETAHGVTIIALSVISAFFGIVLQAMFETR